MKTKYTVCEAEVGGEFGKEEKIIPQRALENGSEWATKREAVDMARGLARELGDDYFVVCGSETLAGFKAGSGKPIRDLPDVWD